MKIKLYGLLFFMLGLFLTGCGKDDAEQQYQDIMVEREAFPDFEEDFNQDGKHHTLRCLGTQFLEEEPVQLWAERYASGGDSSIYLWGLDGKRELLAEGISDSFTIGGYEWYLDREGCFYLINTLAETNLLRKLDSQGKELFSIEANDSITWRVKDICQASDGKLYLAISELEREDQLAELDEDTGVVTVLEQVDTASENPFRQSFDLGAGMDGPAMCRWTDIREVDPKKGKMTDVLLFNGTSYTTAKSGGGEVYIMKDFRVVEKGCVEILWSDNSNGNAAFMERLNLETVQRIPIVLCAPVIDYWMKEQIFRFNQENETYYIVADEFGMSDGTREREYQEALEDYARRISIQVATGKGPDILIGEEVLGGSVADMIDKGALEDLRPYMEQTGTREEDYFPIAFQAWRMEDRIYGICPNPYIYALEADRNIAGTDPDMEGMLEALLAFPEKAVYLEGVDSRALLRLFLEGSETLWGMVDWEGEACDFGGELFSDLLEVAERYGDAPNNDYQRIAQRCRYDDFYKTTSVSELEERGLALAGWMFDDGCHAMAEDMPMAINANSAQKEGAWEFLRFLLQEEAQGSVLFYPVKRDAFARWENRWLQRVDGIQAVNVGMENRITGDWENIRSYEGKDREFLETEKIPYFEEMLEEARYLPIRSVPVMDIVCEEADDYFNGSKSAEEVAEVIENRVRLYLNERKAQ